MDSWGNNGQPSPGNATEAQWEVLQLDVVPGGGEGRLPFQKKQQNPWGKKGNDIKSKRLK